jgi:hypothetical protein
MLAEMVCRCGREMVVATVVIVRPLWRLKSLPAMVKLPVPVAFLELNVRLPVWKPVRSMLVVVWVVPLKVSAVLAVRVLFQLEAALHEPFPARPVHVDCA